jgi:hypothetical protein
VRATPSSEACPKVEKMAAQNTITATADSVRSGSLTAAMPAPAGPGGGARRSASSSREAEEDERCLSRALRACERRESGAEGLYLLYHYRRERPGKEEGGRKKEGGRCPGVEGLEQET